MSILLRVARAGSDPGKAIDDTVDALRKDYAEAKKWIAKYKADSKKDLEDTVAMLKKSQHPEKGHAVDVLTRVLKAIDKFDSDPTYLNAHAIWSAGQRFEGDMFDPEAAAEDDYVPPPPLHRELKALSETLDRIGRAPMAFFEKFWKGQDDLQQGFANIVVQYASEKAQDSDWNEAIRILGAKLKGAKDRNRSILDIIKDQGEAWKKSRSAIAKV